MRINYNGQSLQIKIAVEDANDILNEAKLYELIAQRTSFECSKIEPKNIADIIRKSNLEVEVKFYKSKWPWSSANAYFIKSRPNSIFLNVRRLNRMTPSISNTLVHEYIHAIDNEYDNNIIDFGHNCGTHTNTAPYEIGNIAESIIDGENDFLETPNNLFENVEDNRIINF